MNRTLAVLLLTAGAAAAQTPSFVGRLNYPLSGTALRTRIADFNGDGRPDVAMLLGTSVSIALHDTATWYLPAVSFTPVGRPVDMVVAEVNGDAKLDLILAGDEQGNLGSIQVFLGRGDGTFTAGTVIPNPFLAPVAGLLAADLNGDGFADLLGMTSAGVLQLCAGTGRGTFAVSYASLVFPPIASGRPVLADFNGDHLLDLGYATGDPGNRFIIMLGRGDYSFRGPMEFGMPNNSSGAPWEAADVNGDGRADVTLFVAASNIVYVFPAAEDGSLQPGPGTTVTNATGGGLADLDGDGRLDLVVMNTTSIRLLPGRGDGSFGAEKTYAAGTSSAEVLFADADGDGKTDLFFPGAGFILLRNGGALTLLLETRTNLEVAVSNALMSVEAGDFNGDGAQDLLAVGRRDGAAPTVGVMLGHGLGAFQPLAAFEAGSANSNYAMADLNGDGRADLVFGSAGEAKKYLGTGQGKFGAPLVSNGDFSGTRMIARDFNGDGRPDLLIGGGGVRLSLQQTSGSFAAPVLVDAGVLVEAGDLNGDGKPDLLVQLAGTPAGHSVYVRLNQGNGAFDPAILTTLPKVYQVFGLADLNGDGKLDMVAQIEDASASAPTAGPAAVMLGNGSWNFRTPIEFETLDVESSLPHFTARFADVNADGKLDLVTGAMGAGVKVRLGNGDGTFRALLRYAVDMGGANLQVADLDGDGKPDIVVAGEGTTVSLLYQQVHGLPVSVTTEMKHPGGSFRAGDEALLTLLISNQPGGTAGTGPASASAALDAGLTLVSMSGSGWSCGGAGSTCTRVEDLASGATYPVLTLRVLVGAGAAAAPAARVTVSVGGVTVTATDTLQVLPADTPVFADVPLTDGFASAIEQMRAYHVTDGCAATPLRYCPEDGVTRGQMAVFVVRAMMGGDTFPFPATPYFDDVPAGHQFFKWIQKMKELGITDGCAVGRYCPDASVTRAQMAVFVIRARYGAAAVFPYPADPLFTDVPETHSFYRWIQKMKQVGITSGCAEGMYCPDGVVTRGQMAVFVMRGLFNVLLPAGTPVVAAIWPERVAAGQVTRLIVTGRNTHFVAATTVISTGAGVTLSDVQVVNATTVTAQATMAAGAAGARSITVVTGSEEAVLPNGLRIE